MKPRRGAVQYRQGVDDNDCCSHCLVLQAINTLKSRGHERKCRRKICHASFASKAEKRVTAASVFCRNALAGGMTGALSFCESSQSHRTRHKVSASSQRATTEAYTRVKTLMLRRLAYSNDGGARLPRLAHLLECDTVYIHSVSHLLLHDPNATSLFTRSASETRGTVSECPFLLINSSLLYTCHMKCTCSRNAMRWHHGLTYTYTTRDSAFAFLPLLGALMRPVF